MRFIFTIVTSVILSLLLMTFVVPRIWPVSGAITIEHLFSFPLQYKNKDVHLIGYLVNPRKEGEVNSDPTLLNLYSSEDAAILADFARKVWIYNEKDQNDKSIADLCEQGFVRVWGKFVWDSVGHSYVVRDIEYVFVYDADQPPNVIDVFVPCWESK